MIRNITNECGIGYGQNNDNDITSLRQHLQNHLINDIGSYDEYTIEGYDIFNIYNNGSSSNTNNEPTKSPETEKLYDKLELKKRNYKSNSNSNKNIISQYKKNSFSLYYPNGESIGLFGGSYPCDNSIIFLFEGNWFIWSGIKIGHIINSGIGTNIKLQTINMRPLIFEIKGLITNGTWSWIY